MYLDRQACYSWLRKYIWFKETFTTFYIQYGIEEEPYAIQVYSKFVTTNISIRKSGLWVNKKYPHLGASPDGLIYDSQENLLRYNRSEMPQGFNRSDIIRMDK